jgi:tRNA nucleotidyltransferase/poly(A) polymerase
MTVKLYEVGGYVRDSFLEIPSKDIDFAVEASSWEELRWWLNLNNFEVFLETPQYFTIRARFPRAFGIGAWEKYRGLTADFVLCRKDGEYSDGRRPDEVTPGTIYDDLARRDFTMNAIARNVATGEVLDPWQGVRDVLHGELKCVGNAEERLKEDALRALRAVRFTVKYNLHWDLDLKNAMCSTWLPRLLTTISVERRREELHKAFHISTLRTWQILSRDLPDRFAIAAFGGDIWLKPTTEK